MQFIPPNHLMSRFDVIAIGRSGLDLYAQEVGAPFDRIKNFAAYVGGTPANIAVGTRRLGLRSALATTVSDDPVGDFILRFLVDEGVETQFITRSAGAKSGMTLLGIMPPDTFPRVHYRENGADLCQTVADALALPFAETRAVLVVGTSLTRSPAREATLFCAEEARRNGAHVVLDLDYRADLWDDPLSYAVSVRALARLCDTVIGTEEEIMAAAATSHRAGAKRPDERAATRGSMAGDGESAVAGAVRELMRLGPELVVEKRGPRGSRIHHRDGAITDVPGFRIEVQNTLGAGDAFASGFLFGLMQGWEPERSARFGNACGAIVVGRHACSASCPGHQEVVDFIEEQGGWAEDAPYSPKTASEA